MRAAGSGGRSPRLAPAPPSGPAAAAAPCMNLGCCWSLKRARYGREGKKQTIFLQAFQLIKPRYHTGIETKVILQLMVLAGKKKTLKGYGSCDRRHKDMVFCGEKTLSDFNRLPR